MSTSVPSSGPVADVLRRLKGVKGSASGWTAQCPAHEDGRASLSISSGRDGRVLLHCFAGCAVSAIATALGMREGELFAGPSPAAPGKPVIVATYDYGDATGAVLYQVVRFEPKDFRQRRWDNGAWVWGLKGVTPVLYRLKALREGRMGKRTAFIVEGEKDADALAGLGLVATTNSGGAKKWRPEFADEFAGIPVVILPDNDEPGRAHAGTVAAQLAGIAESVRVVELPGLAPKGDVSDWLSAGGTKEQLREIVMRTPVWSAVPTPVTPTSSDTASPSLPLTDIGNAERLALAHGADLRWVPRWSRFLAWRGTHWAVDETLEAERRVKDVIRGLYQVADQAPTTAERKEIRAWAAKSEANKAVVSALARFKAEPGVAIATDQLNTDPWTLACANGRLDLRTGQLVPARREDLCTKVTPVAYDASATAPRWAAFLDEIMGGDAQLVGFLQRAVGYSLTGSTGEQCLFFLYGGGRNGKSTFLTTLRQLLGDFATQSNFSTFIEKRADSGPRNDIARLYGARVVTSSEIGENKRLNESVIKDLTGGDVVSARFLYAEDFEFTPTFKLWFAANHKPVIRGTDDAIWRRLRLVPFDVQIPVERVDDRLGETLRAELPGILAWAVEGCQLWLEQGLRPPEKVLAATDSYRSDSDLLGSWIEECCDTSDRHTRVKSADLYANYKLWCERNGEYAMTARAFGISLQERGFDDLRTNAARFRIGIALTQAASAEAGARSGSNWFKD